MPDWNRFLDATYQEALKSKDPSTQNGAVLLRSDTWDIEVVARGVNNFPRGVQENYERWERRPQKYFYVEHAERNAIYDAAKRGVATQGLTMVCPWAACTDCSRAIIQSGITTLVRHRRSPISTNERWDEEIVYGDLMMSEAGVKIVDVDPVPGYQLLRNGILRDTAEL